MQPATGDTVHLTVNGVAAVIEADPDMPLLYALRNDLGLVGTRFGCGLEQCGACNVLIDGRVAASCTTPVSAVEGRAVTTVDVADSDVFARLRTAFIAEQAAQCGYCL